MMTFNDVKTIIERGSALTTKEKYAMCVLTLKKSIDMPWGLLPTNPDLFLVKYQTMLEEAGERNDLARRTSLVGSEAKCRVRLVMCEIEAEFKDKRNEANIRLFRAQLELATRTLNRGADAEANANAHRTIQKSLARDAKELAQAEQAAREAKAWNVAREMVKSASAEELRSRAKTHDRIAKAKAAMATLLRENAKQHDRVKQLDRTAKAEAKIADKLRERAVMHDRIEKELRERAKRHEQIAKAKGESAAFCKRAKTHDRIANANATRAELLRGTGSVSEVVECYELAKKELIIAKEFRERAKRLDRFVAQSWRAREA